MSSAKIYHEVSESSDDDNDEITLKDFKKLETLWKEVKDNRKNIDTMKTATKKLAGGVGLNNGNNGVNGDEATATLVLDRKNADNKGNLKNEEIILLQKDNIDLKDKLKSCQIQVNELKDQNTILTKKLKEAEIEIEKCHNKIAKQISLNSIQNNHINEMAVKVDSMSYSQKELIEKSREANQSLLNELEDKNQQINTLKNMLKEKNDKLSVVSVTYDQNNTKLNQTEHILVEKDNEIKILKQKLEEASKQTYELLLNKKSEGTALLEIEHLRGDVNRLVKMLKSTKEYKDFANFADDNTGSIRFIKSNKLTSLDLEFGITKIDSSSPFKSNKNQHLCTQVDTIDEKDVWAPEEAYKFLQEFRKKYKGELTDELIEKLLFELNRIWSKREQQQIRRVKTQCAAEIEKLKRKINFHPTYDEVQAKETINRLKQQLKDAYKEHRDMHRDRPSKNPFGTKYINEGLRMANDCEQAKKQLKSENDFLRSQIRPMSSSNQLDTISSSTFTSFLTECEDFKKKISGLINDFSKKRKELLDTFDGKPELSMVTRKEDWFLESLEEILNTFNMKKWKSNNKGENQSRSASMKKI